MNSVGAKPKFKLFLVLLLITVIMFAAAGIISNIYFGKPQGERDTNSFSPNELELGVSFTVDDIIAHLQYEPLWIKSSDINVVIEADFCDNDEYIARESQNVIMYNADNRTFSVCGYGEGKITILSALDETVTLSLPYKTEFISDDTLYLIKHNYPSYVDDKVITDVELKSIDSIELPTANDVDLTDFKFCKSLSRIYILTDKEVVKIYGIEKLSKAIRYHVNDNLYHNYIKDEKWQAYRQRVFPTVNINKDENVVVLEFNGGSLNNSDYNKDFYFAHVGVGSTIELENYNLNRLGYTFHGWFTSDDNGKTLKTKATSDYKYDVSTKLYAKWTINKYTVMYRDDYVTELPSSHTLTYDEQFEVSRDKLQRTGYTFLGWSTKENSKSVEYSMGESLSKLTDVDGSVITFYAVWTANTYDVEYHPNGGENPPPIQEDAIYGENVQLSTVEPTRIGYRFLGWSMNKNATERQFAAGETVKNLISDSDGKVTLYAVWAANKYTIIFDANGGQNPPASLTDLDYGVDVTLPYDKPTKSVYVFRGWSLDKNAFTPQWSSGAKVSNLVSDPNGTVTLYAVWGVASFTITYNANGGSNPPANTSVTCNSDAFIPSETPNKTGYRFKGWALSASGGVEFSKNAYISASKVNSLYMNGTTTLYAVWEKGYKISVSSTGDKGGSVSGFDKDAYYFEGDTITISGVSYNGDESKYVKVDGTAVDIPYKFTMPAADVSVEVHSDQSCVAAGTLITLADGTQKKVEDIKDTDELLVFDHETGKFVSAPIIVVERDGYREYEIINLVFSNGQATRIIDEHGFFDLDLNKYVYITDNNYTDYIGHRFATMETVGDSNKYLVLENAYSTVEYTGCFSLATMYHMNYLVDGLFSMPGGITGMFNIFEYGDNLAYDEEAMNQDIEEYGLYTYEDFKDYIPELVFEQIFPGKYLKVAVGKGNITFEQILRIVERCLEQNGVI